MPSFRPAVRFLCRIPRHGRASDPSVRCDRGSDPAAVSDKAGWGGSQPWRLQKKFILSIARLRSGTSPTKIVTDPAGEERLLFLRSLGTPVAFALSPAPAHCHPEQSENFSIGSQFERITIPTTP